MDVGLVQTEAALSISLYNLNLITADLGPLKYKAPYIMRIIKNKLQQTWHNRFFIITSIKMDFKARFSRSLLGSVWAILNPLVMVAIYAFILSQIMKAKLPGIESAYAYPIYLISGIIGWTLFTEVISRALMVFIDNAHYLKKLPFPRSNLIFILLGACLINSLILILAAVLIFLSLDFIPNSSLLWLIPLQTLTALFALGIGITCGVLNVFIRDIGQIVPIILQLLFWLTPIVYTINIIPEHLQYLLKLNPVFGVVDMYHSILAFKTAPSLQSLGQLTIMAVISNLIGFILYKKAYKDIVEEL